MKKSIVASLLIFSILACKKEVKKSESKSTEISKTEKIQEPTKNSVFLSIQLSPKSGSSVSGTTEFTENDGVVQMTAKIKGLSEGFHAIHIHDKGDCSSTDGKSSGGHPRSRNGIPAKGFRTRSKTKASNKYIIERRKK